MNESVILAIIVFLIGIADIAGSWLGTRAHPGSFTPIPGLLCFAIAGFLLYLGISDFDLHLLF